MKILFLGEAKKKHVRDWATWLMGQGLDVTLLSDNIPANLEHNGKQLNVIKPDWTFWQNLWTYKIRGGALANNRDKWRVYLPHIKVQNPDIVHAHEALGYGPILPHVPRTIPKVLTPWGPDVEECVTNPRSPRARLVAKACKSADVITTNAGGLESSWAKALSIPETRFNFFNWGTNLSIFKPVPKEERLKLRDKWILPEEGIFFFCPRIPRPLYRQNELLEAWKKFRSSTNTRPAHLLFLSAGCEVPDEWTKSVIPDFSFIDRECTEQEMAELYQLSHYTVMVPQTDLQAQSLLECMACGSVPLLNKLLPYAELVADDSVAGKGRCLWVKDSPTPEGFLEQIQEAFLKALSVDSNERKTWGNANAEFAVANFDENVCRQKMISLYEKLLSGKPRS